MTTPAKAASKVKSVPHHAGHRQRLRDRFLDAGPKALADYEMLELILFRAIPRRDVKPLAKDLLATFGSFNQVITAPVDQLKDVPSLPEAAITELKIIEATAVRLAQSDVMNKPVLSSWNALIDYLVSAMAYQEKEHFRILFLDNKNRIIADEVQQTGTVNHTPVYPREIAKRCLQLNASSVVLVHNHPSGDPTPSQGDISMTKQIVDTLQPLKIQVHDHVIIGKGLNVSFRNLGLM